MPDDDVECESFTIISINSLLGYENKYNLQVYLDNYAYKSVDRQMMDYPYDHFFYLDEDYLFGF